MASLRDARTELATERERRAAAERDACAARHAAEELRERAAARQREADRLRDDNRRLRELAARDRDHAARTAALNEELRYKLRQKSQVSGAGRTRGSRVSGVRKTYLSFEWIGELSSCVLAGTMREGKLVLSELENREDVCSRVIDVRKTYLSFELL